MSRCSYLPLKSGWSIPRLLLYATRIRRQLRISAGLVGDVDRPLPLSARNLEPAACYERRIGVQRVRENGERRARALELAGDHSDAFAFAIEQRQLVLGVMHESGLDLFAVPRQTDPGLDAEEPRPICGCGRTSRPVLARNTVGPI
jgi:hypothetical protein